jgi:hypothetical protein
VERLGGGAAAAAAAAASAAVGPAAGSSTKPGCSAVRLFCLVLLDDAHMASAHFGEGQPPSVEYLEAVAAARAAQTVLDVPPLRREHARRLIVQTAGATPLPAEATELLLDLSQGNPLILRELITKVLDNSKLMGKFAKYASNTLAEDSSAQERGLAWGAKYEQAAVRVLGGEQAAGGGEANDDAASGYARPGKTKNLTVHHLRALLEDMLVFSPRLRGLALQDFGMLSPRALMVAKTAAVYDLFFTRALLREMAAPLLGEDPSTQGGAPAFDVALAECVKLKIFAEVPLAESGLGAQEHAGDAGEDEVSSGLPSGSGGLLTVLQRADPGACTLLCFSNPLTQKAVMDLLLQAQLQQVRRRRARPAACDASCKACSPARPLIRSRTRLCVPVRCCRRSPLRAAAVPRTLTRRFRALPPSPPDLEQRRVDLARPDVEDAHAGRRAPDAPVRPGPQAAHRAGARHPRLNARPAEEGGGEAREGGPPDGRGAQRDERPGGRGGGGATRGTPGRR